MMSAEDKGADLVTRADLKEEIQLLREWMLEREVKTIRWMVGTQIAYFAITLSAVYFLIHFK
jgi:uncharacterized membrane protein YjdF